MADRKGPSFDKSPPELVERFAAVMDRYPDAERKKMFGYPAAFVGGNMATGLFADCGSSGCPTTRSSRRRPRRRPVRADARQADEGVRVDPEGRHRGRRGDQRLGRARPRARAVDAAEEVSEADRWTTC